MPQGSSSRGTQRASSARNPVSVIAVSWWSVPISRALSAAGARSSSTLAVAGEPDRERRGGSARAGRHGRNHRRAVHAAGEEGAVGDVGHHLPLDRVLEALGQLGGELVLTCVVEGRAGALAPAQHARGAVLLDHQRGGGGQLVDALEQRSWRGHEAAGEVVVERGAIDLGLDQAGRDQRADLRRERHAAAVGPPVQGLDAEGVAGGDEPPPALVPEREGEDPAEAAHAVEPVLLVGVDHDLAVRVRREAVPSRLQRARAARAGCRSRR